MSDVKVKVGVYCMHHGQCGGCYYVVDESIGSGRVYRIKGFWYMVVLDAVAHRSIIYVHH